MAASSIAAGPVAERRMRATKPPVGSTCSALSSPFFITPATTSSGPVTRICRLGQEVADARLRAVDSRRTSLLPAEVLHSCAHRHICMQNIIRPLVHCFSVNAEQCAQAQPRVCGPSPSLSLMLTRPLLPSLSYSLTLSFPLSHPFNSLAPQNTRTDTHSLGHQGHPKPSTLSTTPHSHTPPHTFAVQGIADNVELLLNRIPNDIVYCVLGEQEVDVD